MAIQFGLSNWKNYERAEDSPIILLFGDSWFFYFTPGVGNLANRFLDFGRGQAMDFVAIGENGMEIGKPGKTNLHDLTTFFQWESRTVDMIVISGGGNDFAGADDLLPLLQQGDPGDAATWFNQAKTDELFDVIKAGYKRVIYLRDQFAPTVPILTHCYDYSKADGQGVLWFSPWIKPALDQIGMPVNLHRKAVKLIIDRLAAIQTELAGPRYHFVDTRNTLAPEDWTNELHPTGKGFNKIARKFHPHFAHYFPDWIRTPGWLRDLEQEDGH